MTDPAQVSTSGRLGQIITVTGPVVPEDAGPTLLHEHVICDMRALMASSSGEAAPIVTLTSAAEIRWDPYSSPDNYLLDDIETAVDELGFFARGGGGTVVDCTPSRYRDPVALREVARRSGVNIVMGGGHYLEKSHPPGLGDRSLERLATEIIDEVQDGVGDTGIRPGIIGEIGTGDPMTPAERRVLRAMAWAQVQTGLALTVHVHPWGRGGHRVMDVLEAEGVSPDRVILNHAFVDVDRPEYVAALLARGATLGYDMFGFDHALFRVGRYPPSDFEVATEVARLIDAGHASQLILSQDVCVKTRLRAYGGWGYAHVIEHVVPVLRNLGVSAEDLDQMLVRNPARLLAVR